MTDKKSCENCGRTKHFCESAGLCDQWLRNPHLWLDILPTEPGWYWWKQPDSDARPIHIWKYKDPQDKKLFTNEDGGAPLDEYIEGEWQGPIVPNNGGEK